MSEPTAAERRAFIAEARAGDQWLLPPCCRSWAYDPSVHGPSPATESGHHPACPEGADHPLIAPAATVTTVVHVNDPDGFDVYIGRVVRRRGFAGSKWGNPFPLAMGTRFEVIEAYRRHLLASPELLAALPELRGKRLGCWCAPKPCHGDVLAELADAAEPPTPTMVRCPRCSGRGVEPTYGPHFDHDGDNMPTGSVTCHLCRGDKQIVARSPAQ